jgi:hypothetical protein
MLGGRAYAQNDGDPFAQNDTTEAYVRLEGVGFQARLDMPPSVVSRYEARDDRFSAAMHPMSYPVLARILLFEPKATSTGNFEQQSLTFETKLRRDVELVPVSVGAQPYFDYRVQRQISDRWDNFAFRTVEQTRREGQRDGLSIGVTPPVPAFGNKANSPR